MSRAIVEGWVNIKQAAALSGYSERYVRLLAGRGRVTSQKVGPVWLVRLDAVLAHKARMDVLGTARHNPWRPELVDEGRGRRRKAGRLLIQEAENVDDS